jgi:hypothetical protein
MPASSNEKIKERQALAQALASHIIGGNRHKLDDPKSTIREVLPKS